MIKRTAILSPYQKQARNLAREQRLAEIDEMLAWKARVDALLAGRAPAPATRQAAPHRMQGKSQQQSRTSCACCGSTMLMQYVNVHGVECFKCGYIGWVP
jgi:hypothetical protein